MRYEILDKLVQGRGGGREEQPHVQAAAAVQAQEGWEEPLHI